MSTPQQTFGRQLQEARERRALKLETIAHTTKIKLSLLAALERGDVSQWPGGIFRRAFMREYTRAIGVAPEPVLIDFLRLFPDPTSPDPGVSIDDRPLRLTLASERPWLAAATGRQALAAIVDVGAILGAAALIVRVADVPFWTSGGLIALAYYAATTTALGQSASSWWIERRHRSRAGRPVQPPQLSREPLRIVSRQRDMLVADEQEMRWEQDSAPPRRARL